MRGIGTRIAHVIGSTFLCAALGVACSSNVVALEGGPGSSCTTPGGGAGKRCKLDSGELQCVSLDDPSFGCADRASCDSCFVPHASILVCDVTGLCSFGGCQAGYQHCPGSMSSGCDSQSTTDVKNCGGCGNDCEKLLASTSTAAHVTAAKCANSTCQVQTCEPGWKDCDGALFNGCETNCPACCPSGTKCDTTTMTCKPG